MAQGNRVAPDKDFFHQQTQNLLSHPDIFGAREKLPTCALQK
jgi:hypothetical protein